STLYGGRCARSKSGPTTTVVLAPTRSRPCCCRRRLHLSRRTEPVLRADPELPFLQMAWSPSQMQEFLNRHVLPAVWPDQQLAALALDEMHYKPGKQCEITYSLQFADPTRGQSRWAVATFATENELGEI